MGKFIDIVGKKFGSWRVNERLPNAKNNSSVYMCSCDCGVERRVLGGNLRSGKTTGCGCERTAKLSQRRGAAHPCWAGGRLTTVHGYVLLSDIQKDGATKHRKMFEHRYIMSEHLGRPLLAGEHVHHKNGIRDDNRIENLELKVSPHGAKISVNDAIAWAKDILVRYDVNDYYPEEELCL